MHHVLLEVRQSLRRLARQKLAYAATIFAIAATVGTLTLMAGIAYTVLFKPLPYADPAGLFVVTGRSAKTAAGGTSVSIGEVQRVRAELGGAGLVASYRSRAAVLVDGWSEVQSTQVSEDFFKVLGVAPLLGQLPDPNSPDTVVISERLWATYLGRTEDLSTIRLKTGDGLLRVAAVMPSAFDWPRGSTMWFVRAESPAGSTTSYSLTAVAHCFSPKNCRTLIDEPESQRRLEFVALTERLLGRSKQTVGIFAVLAVSLFAVGLVGLSGIVVSDLQSRRREWAIKVACGGSRGQILAGYGATILGLVFVSTMLSTAGIVWFLPVVLDASPVKLPRTAELVEHTQQFWVWAAALFFLTTAVLIGIPFAFLRQRRVKPGTNPRSLRSVAAAQAALSIAILIIALSFAKTFAKQRVDLDVSHPERVRYAFMLQKKFNFDLRKDVTMRMDRARQRLEAVPGVEAVGYTTVIPFMDSSATLSLGSETTPVSEYRKVEFRFSDVGYFKLMGYKLLQGRFFNAADVIGSQRVALVNARLANDLGLKALDSQRIRLVDNTVVEVVGVYEDREDLWDGRLVVRPEIQMAWSQYDRVNGGLMMRLTDNSKIASVNQIIAEELPDLRIAQAGSLAQLRDRVATDPAFFSYLSNVIAVVAVIATLLSIWSLVSFVSASQAQRSAILLALGATQRQIAISGAVRTLLLPTLGILAGVGAAGMLLYFAGAKWQLAFPSIAEVGLVVVSFSFTIVLAGFVTWRVMVARSGSIADQLRSGT